MASVTRSSRRAESHTPHHASPPMRSRPANFNHAAAGGGGGGGIGRMKRAIDAPAENDYEPVKPKKPRIAVEILTQPAARSDKTVNRKPKVPPPAKPAPAALPTPNQTSTPRKGGGHSAKPPVAPDDDQNLTKHQVKVINGIKHELDRLQPQGTVRKEQGRKLRSQEATRFKSELSAYFPDYDEVIGNDPKEEHLLNIDTPIVVFDSNTNRATPPGSQHAVPPPSDSTTFPVRGYGDALYTDIVDSQRIDFSFLEAQYKNKTLEDPLPNSLFEPAHKRAERLERSIRNTEKGRAQHERDQIVRLLEGLQGHDWLRVMGVSGITETKKKAFEPARQHFIQGCQGILDKFRNWSLEEKRRKLEKERALAEQAGEDEEDDEDEQGGEEGTDQSEEIGGDDEASTGDTSEASSPAKQLREEAMARSRLSSRTIKRPRPVARPPPLRPPGPPAPPKEFKSFFSKKYERESALNRTRRAGRKILAFGHPIPEFPVANFDLPEYYRDEETLRVRARKKRRDRRGSRN